MARRSCRITFLALSILVCFTSFEVSVVIRMHILCVQIGHQSALLPCIGVANYIVRKYIFHCICNHWLFLTRVHQTMPPVPLGVIDRSSRCSPLPSGLRLLVPGGGASYRHNSFSGSRHALRLADGSSPGSRHTDLTHSCITWELQCACGTYFVRARPPVSVD